MSDPDAAPKVRRPVRRGEGEVTEWPRGLVEYTPEGPPDTPPSPEEDRTANRIRFAARLLSVLESQGHDVTAELGELRTASAELGSGDRPGATARVERLIARLDERREEP